MKSNKVDVQEVHSGLIQAAGGLLWRRSDQGNQVLVIYRNRYNDWTLPKGKLQEGEDWEEAALREVHEETGYHGRITGFAGAISYLVDGQDKIVMFWHMAADKRTADKLDIEVNRTEWLTVEQALNRLQYPLERALLKIWEEGVDEQMTQGPPEYSLPPDGWKQKILPLSQRKISRERLKEELVVFLADYRTVRQINGKSDRMDEIDDLIQKCISALKRGELSVAWHAFKAAQRTYLYLLAKDNQRQHEVKARAIAIRNEAEKKLKKTSWRYLTIKEHLPDPSKRRPHPKYSVEDVVEAAKILDGYHDNIYRRLENVSSGLNILTLLILLAIGIWLMVAPTQLGDFFSIRDLMITPGIFWTSIFLFGFMGAIFSGYIFSRRQNLKTEIPYQLLGLTLTFARLGVGCLSALITTIFLFARFLNFEQVQYETVLAIAFVAGFSEQFVLRMVQAIAEPEQK